MCQLEKRGANEITELLVTVTFQVHMIEPWSTIGKTKRKRRPSSEQKQTKEQVLQHGFKEAHVLAVFNKGQNERKKRTSTRQKQTEEKVPQHSFKNAGRHSFRTMKNPTTKNNTD